jgi:hypothetical protein
MKLQLFYRNHEESDNEYGSSHFDDKQEVEDIRITYLDRYHGGDGKKISLRDIFSKSGESFRIDDLLYVGQNGCLRNETHYFPHNYIHDTIAVEVSTDYGNIIRLFDNGEKILETHFHDNDIIRIEVIPKDKTLTVYGEPLK